MPHCCGPTLTQLLGHPLFLHSRPVHAGGGRPGSAQPGKWRRAPAGSSRPPVAPAAPGHSVVQAAGPTYLSRMGGGKGELPPRRSGAIAPSGTAAKGEAAWRALPWLAASRWWPVVAAGAGACLPSEAPSPEGRQWMKTLVKGRLKNCAPEVCVRSGFKYR